MIKSIHYVSKCDVMPVRSVLFSIFMVMAAAVSARTILVPAQPVSEFADTEVSTNIVLRASRTDTREFGIHIQTYTDTSVVSETDNESLRIYLDNQKLPLILVPHIKDAQIAPPPKLLCLDYQDPEKVTRFRSYFERQMGGRLDCFQSNPWLLEIVPPRVNKGSSLRFIAEKTGIPIDHTISAGDAENDLSMILAAGIGCAMRNADESLKQQADYVTEHDNNHAGIAEILYRFCL